MFIYFEAINYLVKNTKTFSYPYSGNFVAMMRLHDYIMFFLIVIFIFTALFLLYCLFWAHVMLVTFNGESAGFTFKDIKKQLKYYLTFALFNYSQNPNLMTPDIQKFDANSATNSFYYTIKSTKFSDEPILELIWTLIPAIILLSMALPSFMLLYSIDEMNDPRFSIIVSGNQWFWTYEYSDFSYLNLFDNPVLSQLFTLAGFEDIKLNFDSIILTDEQLPLGYPRLLAVDQPLILPMKTPVRILVTSNDVIHSWALPSYGIKTDAIPGRLNQVNFYAPFFGTSWGQCSELCGINHAFMPIEIRTMRFDDFQCYIELSMLIRYDPFINMLAETQKAIYKLQQAAAAPLICRVPA
jgi:heme/copper-type cytochrome/quinol oxidase subunit 2